MLHIIQPSRGKAVLTALFGEIRPAVWVSDMLGSQRGHGILWQVCLAHLHRDAAYAIECGDTAFSPPFKLLVLRAIAIGRRREVLKDATLVQYLYNLTGGSIAFYGSGPAWRTGAKVAQAHCREPGHRCAAGIR